jgi:hypothetical protein
MFCTVYVKMYIRNFVLIWHYEQYAIDLKIRIGVFFFFFEIHANAGTLSLQSLLQDFV